MRVAIFLLVFTVLLGLFLVKDFQRESRNLELIISHLEEEKKRYVKNKALVCDLEDNASIVYVDCGSSFIPRYSTCFCTTMCLADYSAAYTNSSPENCAHNPYNQ